MAQELKKAYYASQRAHGSDAANDVMEKMSTDGTLSGIPVAQHSAAIAAFAAGEVKSIDSVRSSAFTKMNAPRALTNSQPEHRGLRPDNAPKVLQSEAELQATIPNIYARFNAKKAAPMVGLPHDDGAD